MYVEEEGPLRIDCGLPTIPSSLYAREYYVPKEKTAEKRSRDEGSVLEYMVTRVTKEEERKIVEKKNVGFPGYLSLHSSPKVEMFPFCSTYKVSFIINYK